jgi:hypothetical protein
MKSILLNLIVLLNIFIILPEKCLADVYSGETFSLSIPETVSVNFQADSNDFGQIELQDYGTSNKSDHVITVGDGTENYTFIHTNAPESIANKEFNLIFTGNGDNVNLQQEVSVK